MNGFGYAKKEPVSVGRRQRQGVSPGSFAQNLTNARFKSNVYEPLL